MEQKEFSAEELEMVQNALLNLTECTSRGRKCGSWFMRLFPPHGGALPFPQKTSTAWRSFDKGQHVNSQQTGLSNPIRTLHIGVGHPCCPSTNSGENSGDQALTQDPLVQILQLLMFGKTLYRKFAQLNRFTFAIVHSCITASFWCIFRAKLP